MQTAFCMSLAKLPLSCTHTMFVIFFTDCHVLPQQAVPQRTHGVRGVPGAHSSHLGAKVRHHLVGYQEPCRLEGSTCRAGAHPRASIVSCITRTHLPLHIPIFSIFGHTMQHLDDNAHYLQWFHLQFLRPST